MFYGRLFEIVPETRPMFRGDMEAQAVKLMDTLALSIAQLHDTPALNRLLEDLARRHVRYGVRDEHYDVVREALLWTLEHMLGNAWTADVSDAWSALYDKTAAVMRDAAKQVPTRVA